MGEGALIGAAWANAAMLDTWQGLFDPTHLSSLGGRPSAEAYWAALLVVLLAALIGALAGAFGEHVPRRVRMIVGDVTLLAALLIVSSVVWRSMGGMLTTTLTALQTFRSMGLVACSAVVVLSLTLLIGRWRMCMRAGRWVLLALSPFILVTLGRASIAASRVDFAELDLTVPSRGTTTPLQGPRVIIIVFDELDYAFAFSARPAGVRLPTFDRLRSESVFATNVVSPTTATVLSMPSFILGRTIDSLAWQRPSSKGIFLHNEILPKDMDGESTLFDDAARLGAPSELVGFHLPYCRRSFARLLERCTWQPMTWGGIFDGPLGLGRAVVRQLLALVVVGNRTSHIARVEALADASVRAVSDSNRRLVLLHLPVPHFPPIWDAQHSRYSLTQFDTHAYFDNLTLTDRILARVLAGIDRGATSQKTFVIVTSDHPWRSGPISGIRGGKIPFIVRTPSAVPLAVPNRFESVRLRALTVNLLSGNLTTAEEIATWMGSSPSP